MGSGYLSSFPVGFLATESIPPPKGQDINIKCLFIPREAGFVFGNRNLDGLEPYRFDLIRLCASKLVICFLSFVMDLLECAPAMVVANNLPNTVLRLP